MCNCCERKVVVSDQSPKVIGPYSIGVQGGHFVFTSGQLGLDPATGNLVEGGVEAETHQAFTNLRTVLQAAGSDLDYIVKTTVFLRDINDFSRMNEVYSKFFTGAPPARTAIQAGNLPKGAAVEIEAVAIIPCKDGECHCK
ncbi:MAG: RidA family protein [Anaerolineae bacterium]|nr:RidA family protein [Anaerolineae bacterium]